MGAFEDWDMASVIAYQKRLESLQGKKKVEGIKDIGQGKKVSKNRPSVSKYHNEKVEYKGLKFDSKKEFNRYMELEQLQKLDLISKLERQVPFELQPKFKFGKKTIRAINYIADFVYFENGEKVVEDVKSPITRKNPIYKLKKKMMMYVYGIEVKEV